ncbi:MAG: efflux RND transporter permease subunit, partial [Bacteroidia bacterium]
YSLLPALLHFFTPKKLVTVHGHNNRTYNVMRNGLFWIFRHQRTILVITAVVLVFSVIGIYKVRVNNILLEDLSEHVKIKRDFNFFDQNYSGVRPLEIKVTLNDKRKSLWDYEAMKELDKVDRFITREYNPGFLISPASLAIGVYRSSNEISNQSFPVKEDLAEVLKQLKENRNNKEIKRIITPDGSVARISAKIRDIGSIKVSEHNAHLENYIKSNIDTTLMRFQVTGAAHLVDRNNSYMVSNMTQGFIFSLVVIAILTFFLHRSWRMVLVFIIPNVIPLLIIGGIMGFAGIELKAATSLVFSIAFGIATDDTIHFISRLKIELAYGKSLMYAFKRTYFETGKPIILTTFILLGGFMSLMISNFQSTFYFGFLICITIVVAVIADIFLLPVLLFMIYGKRKK